ncbi:HTH-type transcriptional regulator PgrR [Andreprevotia sp. IGB-42]|uniref:LysR family transcriptional regulator n=1 Tax=Andreprevotia sp. IGB-42 TaxID=2497473 RepID=UPI001359848C|nr:LysR family transcriptional regulator [Andreprevotia sp. IGB-42]KAF0811664.1 HTH-type transcriptional regulator PgrR [Andreprevotia sp. IGB-42]
MKLDQLDGLLAFVTVAQKRSFTAAAALLQVSPPAVSQAVKALEERLGVRLLQRTTRSVSLTEAGERYLGRVAPAVADLAQAASDLEGYRAQPGGLLRLTLPRIAAPLVQARLGGFIEAYPQISLELRFDDQFVDIVAEGFDAGIRLGESVQNDMVGVPLTREERVVIVASPAYLARHPAPRAIEDLREHACICYRFASGTVYRWELQRDGKPVEIEVNGPLTVNDGNFMAFAAAGGAGLAYTFERFVASALASGELVSVLPEACPVWFGFYLYYASRRQMPPKLRCLIDYWKAEMSVDAESAALSR